LLGPIFGREWLTVPRRSSHYMMRSAYLGTLWVLGVTAWQATVGWSRTPTLGDASRFGLILFQLLTLVQLVLLLFFAAVSAAGAVVQEKDRRTFVLLLLTDLRNYEIVLGKLLGSLLQIVLVLLGMVPVLALLILLGGVSLVQVGQMVLILASAALAAGSLGCLVALWRDKTFQTLALTVLFLVLYLCLVHTLPTLVALSLAGLGGWGAYWLWRTLPARALARSVLAGVVGILVLVVAGSLWVYLEQAEWLEAVTPTLEKWLDPIQAWRSVLEANQKSDTGVAPAYGFAAAMLLFAFLLNLWGILRLRVWNPSGEPIIQRERPEDAEAEEKDRLKAHAAPGLARQVWANPILWREIMTWAYGRWPGLIKIAYVFIAAMLVYWSFIPALGEERSLHAAAWGLLPIAVLSLLLVSAQAVTSITSERDSGALDLLLVTDLSPKEFIFGKLGGICYNTGLFLVTPLVLAVLYSWHGGLATPPRLHPELATARNAEALVCIWGAVLVLLAFALVLGVHVALRTQKSRYAIINTLGTIFFLSVGTAVCIYLIWINGRFEYQWASFIFFLAAGIGGLWWVLSGDRPSAALTLASWLCPIGVFYTVMNILVARPGSQESADPFIPFLVMAGAFGFTIAAMVVPLVSEFDVALGRTTGGGE
jgi:ABC-type transport system involved in multi-copper enzyme maturation permease subunit